MRSNTMYHIAHCLSAILMWWVCVPVHLCIAYCIQCLHQFQVLSQLLCLQLIALCRLDIWLQSGKNREISHKAYPGVKLFLVPRRSVTTKANNDQLTCFTIARCHTVLALTLIEKQSGQQLLSACHLPECTCLNGLSISCYPINTSHVQQQFDSSYTKKWGYLLVVADMSYDGKLCLAIIQVPQPTDMHCVHMIMSGGSQRENISSIQELHCNAARW